MEFPETANLQSVEYAQQAVAAVMATLAHVIQAEVGVGPAEIRSAFNPEDPECDSSRQEILGWLALLDTDDVGAKALKSGAFDNLRIVQEAGEYKGPALKLIYVKGAGPDPESVSVPNHVLAGEPAEAKEPSRPIHSTTKKLLSQPSVRVSNLVSQEVVLLNNWRSSAACLDKDPEIFYPSASNQVAAQPAIRICRHCEVTRECLKYALDNFEKHGVWAGTTPRQRKILQVAIWRKNHPKEPYQEISETEDDGDVDDIE